MRWQAAACSYFYLFIFSAAQVKKAAETSTPPGRSLAPALYLDTVDLQVHTCKHFIYITTLHSLWATYLSWMLNICMYIIYNAHRNAGPLMRCAALQNLHNNMFQTHPRTTGCFCSVVVLQVEKNKLVLFVLFYTSVIVLQFHAMCYFTREAQDKMY